MDRTGTMTQRVGENVRRLRRERDISIRVLTEMLKPLGWEISTQGLSRLETGQRGITVDQLAILAEAFDVPMASLLEPPPSVTGWPDTWSVLAAFARACDDLEAAAAPLPRRAAGR